MAWRVMTEKKHSTRLIHEHPVGVNYSVRLPSAAWEAAGDRKGSGLSLDEAYRPLVASRP